MQIRFFAPRADLADLVRAYYLFESPLATRQTMCAEMGNVRFPLSGDGKILWPDGRSSEVRRAVLLGPTLAAYAIETRAGARIFGAGILPKGWRVLFGVGADEFADRGEDLAAVVGQPALSATETMMNASDTDELVAAADAFFAQLLARAARRAAGRFPAALQSWLVDNEDLSLDVLLGAMDVSRRQTDRLAKAYFGASPKLLQRKYRALKAGDRLLSGQARSWRDAAGAGYYDQSHFISDFRVFLGATPGAFLESRTLAAFARGERLRSAGAHPLAGL